MLLRLETCCLDFIPKFPMLPINLKKVDDSNVDSITKEQKIGISIFSLLPFQLSDFEFSIFYMFWNDIFHIIWASCCH